MKPNTPVTKIESNSLHWFVRYGVHKVFGTHKLTHSLTDGQTRTQYPEPFSNGGGGIETLSVLTLIGPL